MDLHNITDLLPSPMKAITMKESLTVKPLMKVCSRSRSRAVGVVLILFSCEEGGGGGFSQKYTENTWKVSDREGYTRNS